jgi:malate dehydrogenase (oxaloacetate-decarboxylating)
VRRAKPTVMIGATGQPNTFNEALVRPMLEFTERPIVMPLSNPTSRAEATPTEILAWTDGRALIASGSPFDPVVHDGVTHNIAQCNNIYIFPAMGLGVGAVNARRVSEDMFLACAYALAKESPARGGLHNPLLPPLTQIREVSKRTAKAIALAAQKDGTADVVSEEEVVARIECKMWEPEYPRYRPI